MYHLRSLYLLHGEEVKIDTKSNADTFTILPIVLVSFSNIITIPNTAINALTNIAFSLLIYNSPTLNLLLLQSVSLLDR